MPFSLHLQNTSEVVLVSYPKGVNQGVNCRLGGGTKNGPPSAGPIDLLTFFVGNADFRSLGDYVEDKIP